MSGTATFPEPKAIYSPEGNPHPRHWTIAEYQRAADLGLFGPEERLELIRGEIIEHRPPNPPHSVCVSLVNVVLSRALSLDGLCLRQEQPIILPADGQPEPDIVVLSGDHRQYNNRHPRPENVELLIEVSDSTLDFDRVTKGTDYTIAGIREYWIINLQDRQLEVHRDPQNGRWATTFTARENESVAPLVSPETPIAVADLLP